VQTATRTHTHTHTHTSAHDWRAFADLDLSVEMSVPSSITARDRRAGSSNSYHRCVPLHWERPSLFAIDGYLLASKRRRTSRTQGTYSWEPTGCNTAETAEPPRRHQREGCRRSSRIKFTAANSGITRRVLRPYPFCPFLFSLRSVLPPFFLEKSRRFSAPPARLAGKRNVVSVVSPLFSRLCRCPMRYLCAWTAARYANIFPPRRIMPLAKIFLRLKYCLHIHTRGAYSAGDYFLP